VGKQQTQEQYSDIGELTAISKSSAFRKVLENRKVYLQTQVNKFVEEQNLIEAYAALKKMQDIDKLVEIINKTIADLKQGGSKNG